MGSRTGEFPDPPRHAAHGEDFVGLTRRSQEPRGVHLQGSNCSNSSMEFRFASTIIHCLALYTIMFIELCFNFMSIFLHAYPLCVQLLFPCLTTSLSFAMLSQAGLLEVHVTYLGSLGYFFTRGPVLSNDCSLEKLMLNRGSRVCSLLSLVLYPNCVYFASLTLTAEYWGSGRCMPLNKVITII
jgi:hypothetical protein